MTQIIPKSRLERWAKVKLYEQRPTVNLIASVENFADKAAIAIVALLDVKPEFRYLGMPVDEAQYLKSCHGYLTWLRKEWETE